MSPRTEQPCRGLLASSSIWRWLCAQSERNRGSSFDHGQDVDLTARANLQEIRRLDQLRPSADSTRFRRTGGQVAFMPLWSVSLGSGRPECLLYKQTP